MKRSQMGVHGAQLPYERIAGYGCELEILELVAKRLFLSRRRRVLRTYCGNSTQPFHIVNLAR